MNFPGPSRLFVKCYKFSLLGQVGVGKTSLAQRFAYDSFLGESADCSHSTDNSYQKQIMVDDVVCLVELLDSEDSEEFMGLRDVYIRNSQAFIFTYSVTSRVSFDNIMQFYDLVRRVKGDEVLGIIVGNKRDKPYHRVVSTEEGEALAVRLGCAFIETSAKTAENIAMIFPDLVRVLRQLGPNQESYEAAPREFAQRRGDRRGDKNVISALIGRLRRR